MSLNTVKYKGELLAEDERISTDTPGVLGEYKELRADALEADTLDITVLSESGTIRNFYKKFYRFSDYLGTTSQMSELLGISSISGILRFGRYPAYHGISEPHLAVKSSKTVVENRPYY